MQWQKARIKKYSEAVHTSKPKIKIHKWQSSAELFRSSRNTTPLNAIGRTYSTQAIRKLGERSEILREQE